MNLENQVCSLDLSKKLKDLGLKQESVFYWYQSLGQEWLLPYIDYNHYETDIKIFLQRNPEAISAFTVAELGEILPIAISINEEDEYKKIFSHFRFNTNRSFIVEESIPIQIWRINYICESTDESRNWLFDPLLTKTIYDANEANARAKMLIYLLENKLMELLTEEVLIND